MQKQTIPTSIGLLILRAGIGGYMATHGWGKLQMVLDGNYAMLGDPIGIGPHASLILTAFAEFACAALVVVGLGTRLAAIPLVIAMGVAAFVAHGADPWSMETAAIRFMTGESESWASKQPALMFLVPFLALAFTGAGRFSLDTLALAWWRGRKGTHKPAAGEGAESY
jgi:putative oxidoreductase